MALEPHDKISMVPDQPLARRSWPECLTEAYRANELQGSALGQALPSRPRARDL